MYKVRVIGYNRVGKMVQDKDVFLTRVPSIGEIVTLIGNANIKIETVQHVGYPDPKYVQPDDLIATVSGVIL